MKLFCTDQFPLPLPEGHRFPAEKYRLLRQRVTNLANPHFELLDAPAVTEEEILRAHTQAYLDRLKEGDLQRAEVNRLGLPWSEELFLRSLHSAGGTVAACRIAIEEGISVCLAGGTHHAFSDQPEGFCVFNDSVIAARAMQAEGRVSRVAVIDTDVHQGNGTATITADDPTIFTFSIHGARNFPFRKASSDLDFALPDKTEDEEFIAALHHGVERTLSISQPDLVIFLAGADPYHGDRFSRWLVTKEGLSRRNDEVLSACLTRRIPVAVTMAGGYGRDIRDTVDIYEESVHAAERMWHDWNGHS